MNEIQNVQGQEANPHSLKKQLFGFSLVSAFIFRFLPSWQSALFLILAGLFTFIDAWKSGIYKRKDRRSVLNISPMAWGILMEIFFIITFPVYVINRNKLKTKDGGNIFWWLTRAFGGVVFLLWMVFILGVIFTVGLLDSVSGSMLLIGFIALLILGVLSMIVYMTPLKGVLSRCLRGVGKKQRMAVGLVCAVGVVVLFFNMNGKMKKEKLVGIFQAFVAKSIPDSVELIEGSYYGFQDHSGHLIFHTDRETFGKIMTSFQLVPKDLVQIDPAGELKAVTDPAIYSKKHVILVWDENSLKAYMDIRSGRGDDYSLRPSILRSRWTKTTLQAYENADQKKEKRKIAAPEEILKEEPDVTLTEAAGMGNLELVKFLTRQGAMEQNKSEALKTAIIRKNYEMAVFLIENGAKPTPNAFYEAVGRGKNFVELLFKNGADINEDIAVYVTPLDRRSRDAQIRVTPLMHPVLEDDIELVKLFLQYGADVNIVSRKEKWDSSSTVKVTALELARKKGKPEIEKLLLEAGAVK